VSCERRSCGYPTFTALAFGVDHPLVFLQQGYPVGFQPLTLFRVGLGFDHSLAGSEPVIDLLSGHDAISTDNIKRRSV
jgi:hypothetical protein